MENNPLIDISTEESVIAHLIARPEAYDEVASYLSNDSFADESCNLIFRAITWSVEKGKVPDLLLLRSLFANRPEDLERVNRVSKAPISNALQQQIDILDRFRKRRIYHDLRVQLQGAECDADIEDLHAMLTNAQERIEQTTCSNVLDRLALMHHAYNIINENRDPNRKQANILTGFRIFDGINGDLGLPPESEVIIAAFSSTGKTAMAMSIVLRAIQAGTNCAIFSAEMGKSSIAGRFLNMMGWNVSINAFKTRPLEDRTIEDFMGIADTFCAYPGELYLDDSSNNNVDYICSSIRAMHRKNNVRLVMVDYLQIIALYDESNISDQEKLARASRKLQAVAKQLGIVVIVLSQFSRPNRNEGHQPSEDLIRGSGQIFEACDMAVFIYRPEKHNGEHYPFPYEDALEAGTAMIKVGKDRDGEAGRSCIVGFDAPKTLFFDYNPGEYSSDLKKNYPKSKSSDPDAFNQVLK